MLLEYIKAIIYGIIEGISEWLPISSTGHLILLEGLLTLDCAKQLGDSYRAMFDVVIQLGAVLAVLVIYWKNLYPFGKGKKGVLGLWGRLILATIPAAVIGLLADKLCEHFLGCDLDGLLFTPQVVASALIIYGMIFILVELLTKKCTQNSLPINARSAIAIGFFQALALVPGTSRSGATILGARILGIDRKEATKFSFFAAIPVISAASLLKTAEFTKHIASANSPLPLNALLVLLVAGGVAFAVSMLTVNFLTDFVKKHTFIPFGIYRIILGIAVLIFIK